jgi:hypothetical protein
MVNTTTRAEPIQFFTKRMPKYKSRDSIDLMVMVKFKLFKSEHLFSKMSAWRC